MIDQLLAQAEDDLERAARRRDLAQALAADWSYWAPILTGSQDCPPAAQEASVERRPAAEPPVPPELAAPALDAPRPACPVCGEPVPLTAHPIGGGRERTYCSAKCRVLFHRRKTRTGRPVGRPRKTAFEPDPDPLPLHVERPFSMRDAELAYVQELLRPPPVPVLEDTELLPA
jgi:hypothetical protein